MKKNAYAVGVCLFLSLPLELFARWHITSYSPPVPLPCGAYFQKAEVELGEAKARVYAVLFDEKKCRLQVIDNPPAKATDLAAILSQHGYFAGINGGYFHTNAVPVGLVVSSSQVLNHMEKARLLSGVLEIQENSIRLVRSHEFLLSKRVLEALQGGPFLIERGQIIKGLNAIRVARRTVVASDGQGKWALISMTPLTLAHAGEVLATRNIFPGWRVANALNLDGGSSTAFWVATKPTPFSIHEWGTVRNFLGLTSRSP